MNKKSKLSPHAFFRGSVLTLDLPAAREPVLWRQEVKNANGVAFSLLLEPDGTRALILRMKDGSEQIIAIFDDVSAANDALAVLRGVLLKQSKPGIFIRILKWMGIVILLWILLRMSIFMIANSWVTSAMDRVSAQTVTIPTMPPAPPQTNAPAPETASAPPATMQPASPDANGGGTPPPTAQ